jgi:hypothetical protein
VEAISPPAPHHPHLVRTTSAALFSGWEIDANVDNFMLLALPRLDNTYFLM